MQHAIVQNERKATLRAACVAFKSTNPRWPYVQAIVIDKDFTEIALLREEFPEARLLLCHFHVIKALSSEVVKPKYNLSVWQRNQLNETLKDLIYARSEVGYEQGVEHMRTLLQEKADRWFAYYDPNWGECRRMWCAYARDNVAYLGNNTNNRYVVSIVYDVKHVLFHQILTMRSQA